MTKTVFNLGPLDTSAIKLLRLFAERMPLYGAFSGGKDSVVIKHIANKAGVPVTWHYSVTGIDPPELVRFIKREHPDVAFRFAKTPFFREMQTHGLPTRRGRWCCDDYKHSYRPPAGSALILGVRAAESPRRAKSWPTTIPLGKKVTGVLPVFDWSDANVWSYIHAEQIPYSELYDEGFKRLGCIGCPMAGRGRIAEFARWPRYEQLWRNAARYYWDHTQSQTVRSRFPTFESLWDWWLNDGPYPTLPDCDATSFALELV